MDLHAAGVIAAAVASAAMGLVGQHYLKASPQVNTTLSHAIMWGVGFGLYAASNPFPQIGGADWFLAGAAWASSVITAGSVAAGAGIVASTVNPKP
jgi:hypothetical protein